MIQLLLLALVTTGLAVSLTRDHPATVAIGPVADGVLPALVAAYVPLVVGAWARRHQSWPLGLFAIGLLLWAEAAVLTFDMMSFGWGSAAARLGALLGGVGLLAALLVRLRRPLALVVPRRLAIALLLAGYEAVVILAGWWLNTTRFHEGPVLIYLTETHGLHRTDLAVICLGLLPIAALTVAALYWAVRGRANE